LERGKSKFPKNSVSGNEAPPPAPDGT